MKQLRTYQLACMEAIWNWLYTPDVGHPVCRVAGGGGKSLLMAEFIKQASERFPGTKFLGVVHTEDLITQNIDELMQQFPGVDVGIYCASLGQKILHRDVTWSSIQSIYSKGNAFPKPIDVMVVDECDMISHNEATIYRKLIDVLLLRNPNMKIIGFTGTDWREDTGSLYEGDTKIFGGQCYDISTKFLLEQGYLVYPVSAKTRYEIDVSNVPKSRGDFVEKHLQKAVDQDEITKACVSELIELSGNKRRWLGMTAGVEHCQHVTDELISRGYNAKMITADTDRDERRNIITWMKRDTLDVRILVNVGTMNVGLNIPILDLLFIMRPTRSRRLYLQFLWRAMRPVYAAGHDIDTVDGRIAAIAASCKPESYVVDFGGVIKALGPIDEVEEENKSKIKREKKDSDEISPTKLCPSCGEICATQQRFCYICSYCFSGNNIETVASSAALLSSQIEPETHEVIGMTLAVHTKKGAEEGTPKTLRVTYATLSDSFSEYICFGHWIYEGTNKYFAYKKAEQWHNVRRPDLSCPQCAEAAEIINYPCPSEITVQKEGKYWRVIGHKFEKKEQKEEIFEEIPF